MTTLFRIPGTHVSLPYAPKLTPAEVRLVYTLEKFFDPKNIFPDLYIPKPDPSLSLELGRSKTVGGSEYVQIDCVAIGKQGIFIFESKDYSGWIYGSGNQRSWTEVLDFGRSKNIFLSPILQNSSHLAALRGLFPPDVPLSSVIVFGREATLKSIDHIPDDTFVLTQPQLRAFLTNFPSPRHLSAVEIAEFSTCLEKSRIIPSPILRAQHISDLSRP